MDKDSVLYLLMDMRVNGVLDRILEKDEEYQEIANLESAIPNTTAAMIPAAIICRPSFSAPLSSSVPLPSF